MNPLEKEVLKGYTDKARKETAEEIFKAIDSIGGFKVVEFGYSVYQIAYGDYITLKQKYGVGL